jgi:hypothetical protein
VGDVLTHSVQGICVNPRTAGFRENIFCVRPGPAGFLPVPGTAGKISGAIEIRPGIFRLRSVWLWMSAGFFFRKPQRLHGSRYASRVGGGPVMVDGPGTEWKGGRRQLQEPRALRSAGMGQVVDPATARDVVRIIAGIE